MSSHPAGLPADEGGPTTIATTSATATNTTTAAIPKGPGSLAAHFPDHALSLSSLSVHADDYINNHRAVAPPLHTSTTFRYDDDPDRLRVWDNTDPAAPFDSHIYSRDTAPNTTRLEAVLAALLGGPVVTYGSGLAAFHALLVYLNPRRIAMTGGYHGCHGVVALVGKLTGLEKVDLADDPAHHDPDHDGESSSSSSSSHHQPHPLDKVLRPGDVIHIETPLNPTGEARDLAAWARLARRLRCHLTVDATFGPPPLQDPLALGADAVLHSGTKYLGGHSDMLCGVVAVRRPEDRPDGDGADWAAGLRGERLFLGSVMGSLEGWLGVRSLRTLELRVARQSASATRLVAWLQEELRKGASGEDKSSSSSSSSVVAQVVSRVRHASLQPEAAVEGSWLRRQMPGGWGPVFSLEARDEQLARRLPSKLHLFHHATSLGGVESLIEWRAITDRSVSPTLLRVSVGVEAWEDLREDLLQGFRALLAERGETREEGGAGA